MKKIRWSTGGRKKVFEAGGADGRERAPGQAGVHNFTGLLQLVKSCVVVLVPSSCAVPGTAQGLGTRTRGLPVNYCLCNHSFENLAASHSEAPPVKFYSL